MRRPLRLAAILLCLASPAWPAGGETSQTRLLLFRVVNFLILAGGIGYLMKKNAGPFFTARSEEIRSGIAGAQDFLRQAEERAAAVERRLATLDQEIAGLQDAARAEMAAEISRLARQADQAAAKARAQAEQEIAAAAKAARLELRSYAASLAVGLAHGAIAGRITPQAESALLAGFLQRLEGRTA